jgi:hypothetical protein
MADVFSIELFMPQVGELFRAVVSDTVALPMVLSEVAALPNYGDARYRAEPFSLVFHAAPGSVLAQQIYRMENERMTPFECFLVPIGPDAQGMRFEAIFT